MFSLLGFFAEELEAHGLVSVPRPERNTNDILHPFQCCPYDTHILSDHMSINPISNIAKHTGQSYIGTTPLSACGSVSVAIIVARFL